MANQNKYTENIFNTVEALNSTSYFDPEANGVNEVELYTNTGNISFADLISIPNWDMKDYINMRLAFQTQGLNGSTVSPFSDPGNYFFKLFFNFNTGYGLLGSTVYNSSSAKTIEENTAYQYLTNIINSNRFSTQFTNILKHKRLCLEKFGRLLNYISNECPWFIKKVNGLNDLLAFDFNNIVNNESKSITVEFNQDALDMRVSTLLSLYRNACFDLTNFREIIPENLRKFDITILTFNPLILNLNCFNSPTKDNNSLTANFDGVKYSSTNKSDKNARLTFNAYILKNCEIVLKDMKEINDSLDNEAGFINENSIKISTERVYPYLYNNELSIQIFDRIEETDKENTEG